MEQLFFCFFQTTLLYLVKFECLEKFSVLPFTYQSRYLFYDDQNFQPSLFNSHSPILWKREIIFFEVPTSLKVHKDYESHC